MKLSVVIPIYNEAGNIPELFERLGKVLSSLNLEYEIIAVNDGSRDESWKLLQEQARHNSRIKLVNLQRNFGQTAAISAGLEHVSGEIIIPMDADLENDPADIPRLVDKINAGYDVVSGWRTNRWQEQLLTRRLPSQVANGLISLMTGLKLHDYGCTLKAYRQEVIAGVKLYGEMHRFIPALAAWQKGKVTELAVNYQPRQRGVSNYGFSRSYRVLLDLVFLKFLSKYLNRPMHFFGGIGFTVLLIGLLAGLTAVILKVTGSRDLVATPLPEFAGFFVVVGVQLVVMGILAEMIMRTYYESQGKKAYIIKEKINIK